MGLFSKHKNNSNNDLPMPPAPNMNANLTNSAPAVSAPAMPPAAPAAPPSQGASLSPPPMPGGSLDDIKSSVASPSRSVAAPSREASMAKEDEHHESEGSEDSLFDMFDLDLPSSNEEEHVDVDSSSNDLSSYTPNNRDQSTSVVNTNLERSDSLTFMKNKSSARSLEKESCFLTTNQFKAMLEIVDSVKSKVKESTDIHLRLLDMKSEEDIEYENLRKNFQFVEDKLYELDSILFDK